MKTQFTLAALATLILTGVSARAGLEPPSPGAAIPDGNLSGITFGQTLSDYASQATVSIVTVALNIAGGYDGNLYSYLVAPNGTMVVLLTPTANSGSGMNITLQDNATAINASSDLSSGTYAASGTLANINGSAANGQWTLFVADEVTGGGTSTLNSWSLDITAVPEPVNVALGVFGGVMGLIALARSKPVKRLLGEI
jgi:subtilisin-like proprotein convertase family protein